MQKQLSFSNYFSNFQLVILGFILLLKSTVSYAQKEGNIWYFGINAGVDFNSGTPVALTDGALNTQEGCSAISDEMGKLLFYTDGIRVWNKNHVQMPNGFGLMGDPSSTQSALIVQKPGSNNIYYIFTTEATGGPDGFRYSIVDMTLQAGLGDVTTKNTLLHTPVTEKLTAVRHANGCDIWVIVHEWGTDGFRAFHVDSSGVNLTPVISNTGTTHIANFARSNALGQLKASPDGKKLALAIFGMRLIELLDFNNATGQVSNPISFPPFASITYGIEFSPDGTKLYAGLIIAGWLYQYDLMAGSSTDIINSRTLVGSTSTTRLNSLQLGPDGKIYCAKNDFNLAVVSDPNKPGIACNFIDNAVPLNGRFGFEGLPTFMQSHFYPQFTYLNPCAGDSTLFSITDTMNVDSVSWIFGDTASGSFNTSSDLSPYHIFSAPGRYNVQMTRYAKCNSVFSRTVIIYPVPEINLGNDTLICPEDSLVLDAQTAGASYLWQDGSTKNNFTVSSPGTFWVEVTNACGSDTDTIDIGNIPVPELNLGNDTVLCPGQLLILDATITGASYLWQDNSIDSIFTVSSAGFYWVEVTSIEGCFQSDSITTSYSVPPDIALGNDTLLCQGDELILDVTTPGAIYQWQDNSTSSSYTISGPGLFWVEVTNTDGCSGSDSIVIDFSVPPAVSLGNDTTLCEGQSLQLIVNIPGVTYAWQDNSTDSVFTVSSPGLYWIKITNGDGCSSSDSVTIEVEIFEAKFEYAEVPCTNQIQFINLSSDTSSSFWDFGDGATSHENNPSHTYQTNEKYRVILIINPDSTCADTVQAVIPFEIDAAADTLFIPNVFTPNGDGKNDYFEILGANNPCVSANKLTIYSRWGKKVFESEGNRLTWDGTKNENILTSGVYFYVLEGEDFKKSGNLTLIR